MTAPDIFLALVWWVALSIVVCSLWAAWSLTLERHGGRA